MVGMVPQLDCPMLLGYNCPVSGHILQSHAKKPVEGMAVQAQEATLNIEPKDMERVCMGGGFEQTRDGNDGLRSPFPNPGQLFALWRGVKGPTQLLAPIMARHLVLHLAHDIPMAGHLGADKTLSRVLQTTPPSPGAQARWIYLLLH